MSTYLPLTTQYPLSATLSTTATSIGAIAVTTNPAVTFDNNPVYIRKFAFKTGVSNSANVNVYLRGVLQDTVGPGTTWNPLYDESAKWFDSSQWTLASDGSGVACTITGSFSI